MCGQLILNGLAKDSFMQLTPDELIDILLQKPGRITAGILDKRNPLQKMRDDALAVKTTDTTHYGKGLGWPRWKQEFKKNFMHEAWDKVPVEEESNRSLKKALSELRYIGYEGQKIDEIRSACIRFFLRYYSNGDTDLLEMSKEEHRGYWATDYNDRAFLGNALIIALNDVRPNYPDLTIEDYYSSDNCEILNVITQSPINEVIIEEKFRYFMRLYIKSRNEGRGSINLLKPEKPQKIGRVKPAL